MKNFYFIIMGLLILTIPVTYAQAQNAQQQYENTLQLTIDNSTGSPGFFGTCSGEISPSTQTLCSTPQEIPKGASMILVPPYQKSYPVFSTDGTNYYSCATIQKPTEQLFFSTNNIRTNTLLLESFIPDSKGNNVAVLCGLQSKT